MRPFGASLHVQSGRIVVASGPDLTSLALSAPTTTTGSGDDRRRLIVIEVVTARG